MPTRNKLNDAKLQRSSSSSGRFRNPSQSSVVNVSFRESEILEFKKPELFDVHSVTLAEGNWSRLASGTSVSVHVTGSSLKLVEDKVGHFLRHLLAVAAKTAS